MINIIKYQTIIFNRYLLIRNDFSIFYRKWFFKTQQEMAFRYLIDKKWYFDIQLIKNCLYDQ